MNDGATGPVAACDANCDVAAVMHAPTPLQALAAEFLGTALLLATVVGSGIMGEQLSAGNNGIALLANASAIMDLEARVLQQLREHFVRRHQRDDMFCGARFGSRGEIDQHAFGATDLTSNDDVQDARSTNERDDASALAIGRRRAVG